MLKALVTTLIQTFFFVFVILAGMIAYAVYRQGMDYLYTPAFHDFFYTRAQYTLAAAAILFLVIICYRATRRTLED